MSNKGCFDNLYTFQQISKIYNIDSSTLRKKAKKKDFRSDEVKKFGGTWLITEQAMIKHFGARPMKHFNLTGNSVIYKPRANPNAVDRKPTYLQYVEEVEEDEVCDYFED
ncbi:MAG: helix-turn-helix domain-containing protein [Sarcina sp.]